MPPINCCVQRCWKSTTSKHRFPDPQKYADLFNQWVHLVGDKNLLDKDPQKVYTSNRVCSIHFKAEDFGPNNRLKTGVLPSINLPASLGEIHLPQTERPLLKDIQNVMSSCSFSVSPGTNYLLNIDTCPGTSNQTPKHKPAPLVNDGIIDDHDVNEDDVHLDKTIVVRVPYQNMSRKIQKKSDDIEKHHEIQKSEIMNISKNAMEMVSLSENRLIHFEKTQEKRLEWNGPLQQVEKEHGEPLSTDLNKYENTTNMQENETSDKENISISITKEQLEQKCRTCFIRNGTINVFTKYHEGILFRDLLQKFSLAEIHQSDGLPQRICTYCSSFIINLCSFKKEIDKSLIKLKAAIRQLDNQNIPESQCEGSNKSKAALRQLDNLNISESQCEESDDCEGSNKSKAALRQVDNLNISESQCEESDDSKVPRNVYKVVENLKIQVYVEGEEDNESKNEIIQQIIVAPSQGNNKNEYINKDRIALEESRFDAPNADYGSHDNFRSLLNNISNIQRKYLRTRKLLMSQNLKRSNTSVLLDHNYIKSVDRNNDNTNKKRGKEKKKETLCPCCKKGQKFRIHKFLNRQICFDKYSHCDKYTCTYCHSKHSLWLKYGTHNRGKHRNKHFYA
ncbi:unnamed protein product [Diabrotica balteata]|uniref:THAP-type domain-containing protein n=1 Tax=Diabrotica balteata TaxID=107213 RepID=A0A9N9T117_DIABA|nr:unnamed protein product [Diabrotica balteata]